MAYGTFTLTGTHQDPTGTPHAGKVLIKPNAVIRDATGNVILSGSSDVTLDAAGSWSVVLPADDPTLSPSSGLGYRVTYRLHSSSLEALDVAAQTAGTTHDVADLTSSTALAPLTSDTTVLDTSVAARVGDTGSATRAALDGAIGLPAYNLRAAGLKDSTANLTTVLDAAVAAGARHIVIPYRATPWPMTTTFTATGIWLDFEPGARVSFNMSARAMDLTACRLTGASFTSPYAGPTSAADASPTGSYVMFAREVRLGSDCVVDGYYHENAGAGIHIETGNNISLRNLSFKNIRQYQGWAAAIHVSSNGAYNVHMDGIEIVDCDRGIEIESGARDVSADNGHQKNVYPKPYTGQPADFATYTFVLGAHSHLGEGACINITHKNWLIENCGSAVTFVRSNGTDPVDHPRNCSAENIRILGMAMSTGYEAIAVQGYNNVVRGIHFMEGAGITSLMRIRVWGGGSENNRIEDVRAETYTLPLVTVDDQAAGTVLGNCRAGTPLLGTGYIFDVSGRYTAIAQASAFSVTGTTGYVRFQATADYSKIDGFNYNIATAETFAQVVLIDGAENVIVTGVQGSNFATTPPVDVNVTGAARFANISSNNFDRSAAGAVIALGASATRNLVRDNMIGTANGTITNAGTENTIDGNKRGNWVDVGKGTATIAAAASSVTFNHGVSGAPELVYISPRVGELLWVSAITSTQLTVSRTGTTGAHTFDWRAENNPAS